MSSIGVPESSRERSPASLSGSDPPGSACPAWGRIAAGVGVALLVQLLAGQVEASADEATWLRWLRVLADHPVRCGVAATLVAFALLPVGSPARPGAPARRPPA